MHALRPARALVLGLVACGAPSEARALFTDLRQLVDRVARLVKPYPFGYSTIVGGDCREYAGPLSNRIVTPAS